MAGKPGEFLVHRSASRKFSYGVHNESILKNRRDDETTTLQRQVRGTQKETKVAIDHGGPFSTAFVIVPLPLPLSLIALKSSKQRLIPL